MTTQNPSEISAIFPAGYTLHPATLADLDAVLSICVAQNLADYLQAGITADRLRESWLEPTFHPGMDHWLVRTANGQPAAYGELRDDGSGVDFDIVLALDPELWANLKDGAPIAFSLLECINRRAAQLAGANPFRLSTRTSIRNPAASQILETSGYRRSLTFNIMDADLTEPPTAVILPDGVTIRAFVPDQDDQSVYQVDEESGEDKGYHHPLRFEDWCIRMSRHTPFFDPGLWFLAYQDEVLAGVALNLYDPNSQTAWVDHLGVRRAYRCRGIGMALLMHSLNVFRQRGYPTARLSVDSHSLTHAPRLYEKAGFQTVLGYHIYHK